MIHIHSAFIEGTTLADYTDEHCKLNSTAGFDLERLMYSERNLYPMVEYAVSKTFEMATLDAATKFAEKIGFKKTSIPKTLYFGNNAIGSLFEDDVVTVGGYAMSMSTGEILGIPIA